MKQRIKTFLAVLVAACLCFAAVACANDGSSNEKGGAASAAPDFPGVLSEDAYASEDEALEAYMDAELYESECRRQEKIRDLSLGESKKILGDTASDGVVGGKELKLFCRAWRHENTATADDIARVYLFTYQDGSVRYFVTNPAVGELVSYSYLATVTDSAIFANCTVTIEEKEYEIGDDEIYEDREILYLADNKARVDYYDDGYHKVEIEDDEIAEYRTEQYLADKKAGADYMKNSGEMRPGQYLKEVGDELLSASEKRDGSYELDDYPYLDFGQTHDFDKDGKITVKDFFYSRIILDYCDYNFTGILLTRTATGLAVQKNNQDILADRLCGCGEGDDNTHSATFELRFKNGKLEKIAYDCKCYDGSVLQEQMSVTITFSDFGKTSVTIPAEVDALFA